MPRHHKTSFAPIKITNISLLKHTLKTNTYRKLPTTWQKTEIFNKHITLELRS